MSPCHLVSGKVKVSFLFSIHLSFSQHLANLPATDTKMRGEEFHRLRLIHLISCMCRSEVRSDNLELFKADLHFGDYRSRLMHYEAQKNIFYAKKRPSLE